MLANGYHVGEFAHSTRTLVDHALMERTGIDELSLRSLRRDFLAKYASLSFAQKRQTTEEGIQFRLRMMVQVLFDRWAPERWGAWLRYLEHTQKDIDEMCRGEYPISPYLARLFSALFGIKVDFLLLGVDPRVDKIGTSIDLWPMAGAR